MNKDTVLKLLAGLLVALIVAAFIAGEVTKVEAYQFVSGIAGALLLLVAMAIPGTFSTEFVKAILRFLFTKFPLLNKLPLQPSGIASLMICAVLVFAGINKFDLTVFDQFEVFKNVDKTLLQIMTTAVTLLLSSSIHDALPDSARAQKLTDTKK